MRHGYSKLVVACIARLEGFRHSGPLWCRVVLAYLACELLCWQRFRVRMASLRVMRRGDRRGTLDDLRWVLKGLCNRVCPLSISKHSLQRHLDFQKGLCQQVCWEHYYVLWQDLFCLRGPSPEEHTLLLQIAEVSSKQQHLAPPAAAADQPPTCVAPLGCGWTRLQVVYKPFLIELLMACLRVLADNVLRLFGYRGRWLPTPEGWIRYWVRLPKYQAPQHNPIVFIHGMGMGAAPYVIFLKRLFSGWQAPLVLFEMPNCSRACFQSAMPSATSLRVALEQLLQYEFGIASGGKYVLLGHSLGTDYCSMILNDPGLNHGDTPLRPGQLVLLDPICFVHEFATSHLLPFWTVQDAFSHELIPGAITTWHRWWKMPLQFLVLLLMIRDEHNQEATKRCVGPGTDAIFRCPPSFLKRCPTLVCLSGKDAAVPSWKVYDYLRAHFPEIEVCIDPEFGHGHVNIPWVPRWHRRNYADTILRFLVRRCHNVPQVQSEPILNNKRDEYCIDIQPRTMRRISN